MWPQRCSPNTPFSHCHKRRLLWEASSDLMVIFVRSAAFKSARQDPVNEPESSRLMQQCSRGLETRFCIFLQWNWHVFLCAGIQLGRQRLTLWSRRSHVDSGATTVLTDSNEKVPHYRLQPPAKYNFDAALIICTSQPGFYWAELSLPQAHEPLHFNMKWKYCDRKSKEKMLIKNSCLSCVLWSLKAPFSDLFYPRLQ